MGSRKYLVGVLVVVLLIWGPIDHSWPAWLVIRTGYLIAIPVAAWFLLKWIWEKWQPDAASEIRLERALAGVTGGVLTVTAILAALAHTHGDNTLWVRTRDGMEAVGDDITLPGPDWSSVFMLTIAAVYAIWFSAAKRESNEPSGGNRGLIDSYFAFQKGQERYVKGEYLDALHFFDQAIDQGYEHDPIYLWRGVILQSLHFDLDAIDDLDRAALARPDDCNVYFLRSLSKSGSGDLRGSISDLETAIRLGSVDNERNRTYNETGRKNGSGNIVSLYTAYLGVAKMHLEWESDGKDHPSQRHSNRVRR